ncbi:5'-nucleotidase, partial [Photobacterium profundum]
AGGVRTNIMSGDYREGNVSLELLPFSNFISVLPVEGSVIKDLIASTIEATLPEGAHAGKFPYGGNLRYTFTETVAGTSGKLDSVEVNTGTLEVPAWTPLVDNTTYNVSMNSYNASGNDGWTALYDAQTSDSGRVDLAFVDGKLTAFPVSHLEKDGNDKTIVKYEGEDLDCKDETKDIVCNTDAQAVIDYIAAEQKTLTPISYETVTLNRVK